MGVQMTSQDDFLNMMDEISTPMEKKEAESPSSASPNQEIPKGQVIERTMHTITQFRIYPNGQIFIKDCKSWMDKAGTIVKKKEKPKPIKVQQIILQEKEEY